MRFRMVFNVMVIALLGYLLVDRALLHAQGLDADSQVCAQGAEHVRAVALSKGFGPLAADSQADMYRSGCLVTGRR